MTVLSFTMTVPTGRDSSLHSKAAYNLGGIRVLMCSCNRSEVVQLCSWCPISAYVYIVNEVLARGFEI